MSRVQITLPPKRSGISKEQYVKECINYMKNVEKCCADFINDAPDTYDWGGIEIAMQVNNALEDACNDLLKELKFTDKFVPYHEAIFMLQYAIHEKEMIQIIEEIIYPYSDVKICSPMAEFKGEWEIILQDKYDHKSRFKQQVKNISNSLKHFAYAGVTQHILEDDDDKIMITFQDKEVIDIKERKEDAIKFFKLMGFIEICDEHDLSAGPSETIKEYNKTVVQTEELAQKYGLYNEKEACEDDWYHLYVLWPQMKEFFKKQL